MSLESERVISADDLVAKIKSNRAADLVKPKAPDGHVNGVYVPSYQYDPNTNRFVEVRMVKVEPSGGLPFSHGTRKKNEEVIELVKEKDEK